MRQLAVYEDWLWVATESETLAFSQSYDFTPFFFQLPNGVSHSATYDYGLTVISVPSLKVNMTLPSG